MILSAPLVIVSSLGILLVMAVSGISSLLRSTLLSALSFDEIPARASSSSSGQYPAHLYPGLHEQYQSQFNQYGGRHQQQQHQDEKTSSSEAGADIFSTALQMIGLPAAMMVK